MEENTAADPVDGGDPYEHGHELRPVKSLKEMIRDALDVRTEDVYVAEWNVTLKVRGLSRGEVRSLPSAPEDAAPEVKRTAALESEVISWSLGVVDPQYTEDEARELLQGKAFGPTQTVLMKILDLSGLGATFRAGDGDSGSEG